MSCNILPKDRLCHNAETTAGGGTGGITPYIFLAKRVEQRFQKSGVRLAALLGPQAFYECTRNSDNFGAAENTKLVPSPFLVMVSTLRGRKIAWSLTAQQPVSTGVREAFQSIKPR
jgi:hypothetical protein